MADVNRGNRPLSPYMFGSLYKWQISSVTSSLHRISGVFLFAAFALLCLYAIGLVTGGWFHALTNWLVASWLGKIFFFFAILALWYHLLNGLRHLAWDFGYGFNIDTAYKTGVFALGGSVVLTLITIFIV